METIATINLEGFDEAQTIDFKKRTAARAVITDHEGNIAMLWVSKNGYHKLPGGGVEEGEDLMAALIRECREEAGCEIEVISEIGMVKEIRAKHSFVQESFAYLAELRGEKGEPDFTPEEIDRGFKIVWIPLTEVRKLMKEEEEQTLAYEGKYMVLRDFAILEEAQRIMKARGAL